MLRVDLVRAEQLTGHVEGKAEPTTWTRCTWLMGASLSLGTALAEIRRPVRAWRSPAWGGRAYLRVGPLVLYVYDPRKPPEAPQGAQ